MRAGDAGVRLARPGFVVFGAGGVTPAADNGVELGSTFAEAGLSQLRSAAEVVKQELEGRPIAQDDVVEPRAKGAADAFDVRPQQRRRAGQQRAQLCLLLRRVGGSPQPRLPHER